MEIRAFESRDEHAVVALWRDVGLTRPWNDPRRDIERKLDVQPELFVVGTDAEQMIATAMAGYDGHRGWIYYLAVAPAHRRRGHGARLVRHCETLLESIGCPKVNLMVRSDDGGEEAVAFYTALGYEPAPVHTLGRRLIPDA